MAGGTTEPILAHKGRVFPPDRALHLQLCSSLAGPCSLGVPVLPLSHKLGHPTDDLVHMLQMSKEKVLPLQESKQTIPAGLRSKGFPCQSQTARLGNNVSALNLIYLLISQTTCFFYCIYFKHSFKLCIIFQSF